MRPWAFLLLIAAACGASDDTEYPIEPGHGGTGGSFQPIADPLADASTTITGRVCVLADPRMPTTCAATGADGLTVKVGTLMTMTTTPDGKFSIMRPTGTGLMWTVSGTGIRASAIAYHAVDVEIPAVQVTVYEAMVANIAETDDPASTLIGALLVQFTRNNTPVSGAITIVSPTPDSELYYDGSAPDTWRMDTGSGEATGAAGMVWAPRIQATTMGRIFIDDVREASDLTVVAGHLTFVFAKI